MILLLGILSFSDNLDKKLAFSYLALKTLQCRKGKKSAKEKMIKEKEVKKKNFNHYALLKKNAYCVLLSVSVCTIFFINLKHNIYVYLSREQMPMMQNQQ